MGETIDAFIEKLQADGVETGRVAAEEIRTEAEQQARQIIADAEDRARQCIAETDAQCEKLRLRSESELKLAARDTVVRLRATLLRALRRVLTEGVRQQLEDEEFLRALLRDLVTRHAKVGTEGAEGIQINVSKEMHRKLAKWAIETIRAEHGADHRIVELHGNLADAGFEYSISEGTTEITVQSVVEVLSELVGAELRGILNHAVS